VTLLELETVLRDRRGAEPEQSYTARLLADPELNQRKIMEEAFEICLELGRGSRARDRIAEESADLLYHLVAGLVGADVALSEVFDVLESRR
jgi:phosphoribosyl-ATP pyrophosphohydrolase